MVCCQLLNSRAKLQELVTGLWERVRTLWERLDVPQHEQELFEQGKLNTFKGTVLKAVSTIDSLLYCQG